MDRSICVFCSSSERVDKTYFKTAEELALKLAENQDRLIYGGARIGIMGKLANAALAGGVQVTGIIPRKIHDYGLGLPEVHEYQITKNMQERKKRLIEKGDVFFVLPGGFGTLEEMMEVLTLKQLGYHQKAVILINTNLFFNPLLNYFESLYSSSFAKEDYRQLYYVADDVTQAYQYLKNYHPENPVTKW